MTPGGAGPAFCQVNHIEHTEGIILLQNVTVTCQQGHNSRPVSGQTSIMELPFLRKRDRLL